MKTSTTALGPNILCIELPITKSQKLCQSIQKTLEQRKEAGQPDDQADGTELHQALQYDGQVEAAQRAQAVLQDGRRILHSEKPYCD